MRAIYFILFLIRIPALFIHELSHVIFLYLTFNRIDGFKITLIDKKYFSYEFEIQRYVAKYKFAEYLIGLSPYIALLSLYIISIFSVEFATIFIPYSIIAIKSFLPSQQDYDAIKNWKSRDQIFYDSFEE